MSRRPSRSPSSASGKPLGPLFLSPGSKRRLADAVVAQAPDDFGAYFEPFLEGGTVAVAMMERFPGATFHMSSDDAETVTAWQAVADDVEALVSAVGDHIEHHSRDHVTEVGNTDAGLSPVERAARFIYLRGAVGRDQVAFDEGNARRLAALLNERDVRFASHPFFAVISQIGEEDLVFLDPPFSSPRPPDVREVQSLVGTVTARGAYVIARGASAYSAWNTMAPADDPLDEVPLSVNRTLARARRR